MLSLYRSGLLALTLVGGLAATVEAQIQRTAHEDWFSDVVIERLQDKSVLTEYFGETAATQNKGVVFRVGFIPRFGCAPLITFKFGEKSASGLVAVSQPTEINSLSVSIDGTNLPFDALADSDSGHHSLYMNASLQRRILAKLKVEVGNNMLVRLGNEQQLAFSLLGSRDAISIANQNCRRHDPSLNG